MFQHRRAGNGELIDKGCPWPCNEKIGPSDTFTLSTSSLRKFRKGPVLLDYNIRIGSRTVLQNGWIWSHYRVCILSYTVTHS